MPHNQATRPYPPPPGQDIRYEHEIRLLEGLNRSELMPANPAVFTGSSIFRFWSTLAHDMAPLPVVNRAFGGARTWEVLHFFSRIIMPCRPAIIAYYCGSNDIECGEEPEGIAGRFEAFGKQALDALPLCRVFFISINLAPQKRARWDAIQEANRLVVNLCEKTPSLSYIDVNPALLDAHGQPRSTLYQEDGLHLRPAAYQELSAVIRPVLLQAWQEMAA
jgi:hypothetical protein